MELEQIKKKCKQVLGEEKYQQMYGYVKHLKETIKRKDKIDLTLSKFYGQNEYELAQCIGNIIDYERGSM